MADIFVSYASEDRARIEPLVAELEGAGYSVWWDRQLKGGTRFSSEIETEVRHARVVLVAWSPNAIKSRWVADEADLALETGNLLPISLDGIRSPMGFRQLQTIDFSGWSGGKAPCISDLLQALDLLMHFDDPDPDGWGPNYDIGASCNGATLSLYLSRKLGKRARAALILDKLKYIHQTLLADPDGIYFTTDYLSACIAMAEGNKEAALEALEDQWARSHWIFSQLIADVIFEELEDEPRYKALLEQSDAHLAAERKAAEDAGLLPVPEELLASLREE